MSDDKPTDDVRAKAAFAVAKHAVERALDDATEDPSLARSKRNKRIALGVIGALLLIGLVGLMLNYWYWALLLGLVGAAGWYARRRWRARAASRKKIVAVAPREAPARSKVRVEPRAARQVTAEPSDESIDDNLAELKSRMRR